jgi:glutathione synthase/RimK-type ligase-like ATP-grasp enzyme
MMTCVTTQHAAEDHTTGQAHAPLIGLPKLMKMAFAGVDLAPLGAALLARAENDPDDFNALLDLSIVLQLRGDHSVAMSVQAEALKSKSVYCLPAAGQAKIRVLAIMGPGDLMANTPLEFLLEDSDVALDMVYVGPGQNFPASLPEHDLVFVAIGESDQNHALLQNVENLLRDWPAPVLNPAGRIDNLSRDGACALLQDLPGVVMPITARLNRQTLERIGNAELAIPDVLSDANFPIIVRPIDSHAGRGLAKLDDVSAVEQYLLTACENEFYVAGFVDYRGSDGMFRKCRVVLIDGRPFVCHMAISARWMVHYLNADMTESAGNRAEEARFMAAFDDEFGHRHASAFQAITTRIGLDYLGIDCGETPDGKLLIFEIDSNMIVHAMDPVEVFPYKQPQMRKVFAAFRHMLAIKMNRQ